MKQLTIFVVLFQFSCFLIDRRLVHHTSTVHLTDQQLKFSLWGDNLKEMDCEPPTYLSYFSMIASLCLSCITIAGNLLVLLAVYQDPYKELRKPFTFLIANLALADLTAGAITEPMAVYFTYQEVQGSVVNDLAVYVTHLSYFMSCTTSVLTLSVLAIDRYLAISYSLWYKCHVTLSCTIKICMALWIMSVLLSLTYIKTGYINFAFVFANTAVLSTASVLVFAYYRIFKSLRIRTIQVGVLHEGRSQRCERQKSLLLESKLTKLYLMMLGIFLLCFVPSCLFIYVLYCCSLCDCSVIHWLRDTSFLLVLSNSSLNPILYSLQLKSFRRVYKSMCKCAKKNRVRAVMGQGT